MSVQEIRLACFLLGFLKSAEVRRGIHDIILAFVLGLLRVFSLLALPLV